MHPLLRFLASSVVVASFFSTDTVAPADTLVPFVIDKDGRVSLAVYDSEGRMVRTLLTGAPRKAGQYVETWDGLDRYGHPLPAGDFTWRLLATNGLRAEFITQVGQNVDPAWEKATGNHEAPSGAAIDRTGLYRVGATNEGGHWGVKTDLDGRHVWINDRSSADPWAQGTVAVTLVNNRLFELMPNGHLYGYDATTGHVFTGGDYSPKPWDLGWEADSLSNGQGDAARKERAARCPRDLAGDAADELIVAAYPQYDRIAWFRAEDGSLIDKTEGLIDLAGVAVDKDGAVFAISHGQVVTLTRANKTPRVVIAAEQLECPWRLCVSPASGDIYVAENSDLARGLVRQPERDFDSGVAQDLGAGVRVEPTIGPHHQVKRFSLDGKLLQIYGKPEGRVDGVYVPTDFRHLTDVEADPEGGFVITEGHHTPPRRTARFGADGQLLREWLGAQHYGIIVCPEPDDPRHVWFMANADQPALVRCDVDYDQKSARVVEIYQDVFTRNPFARVPAIPTLFGHEGRIYIQGGGVQPHGLTLSIYDPAAKQLRPCNASGSRDRRNYLWNDLNDDGLATEDEVEWIDRNQFGGYVDPHEFLLVTTVHATGYQPGHRLAPARFTAGGTPVFRSVDAATVEPWVENGLRSYPFDCRRGPDGSWYACFADSFRNPNEGVENHGAWYYNSCSAYDRLVKWDRDWKPLWSVGKHSSDNDHELGTTAMPRGLVGFTHDCVVLGDASDEESARPSVWTEDGLFVDELLRVPVDTLRKEEYGEENTNEYPTGHLATDPESGEVYYYALNSTGGSPIYRISGWEGWQRNSGTIRLNEAVPQVARRDGTGLKGEYFNTPDCSGEPVMTRTDPLVFFYWFAGKDGWPEGVDPQSFSCRWTGHVEAPTTENYRFVFESYAPWRGEGWGTPGRPKWLKLWIGGNLVLDTEAGLDRETTFGLPQPQGLCAEVPLQAGQRYDLRLEGGFATNAVARLCWETPGLDRRAILPEFLHPEPGPKRQLEIVRDDRTALLADFGFEETDGALCHSRVGAAIFGRLTGNARRVPGKVGMGVELEGRNEFDPALLPIDEELRLPDTNYAVAFWFKTTANDLRLCEAKRYSSYNNRWSDHTISITAGKLRFELQGDSPLETPRAMNDGQWHHVVTAVGEGGQRLYVDDQLIATGHLSRRTKTSNRLGLDLGPGGQQGSVAIDEVKVFGRAF